MNKTKVSVLPVYQVHFFSFINVTGPGVHVNYFYLTELLHFSFYLKKKKRLWPGVPQLGQGSMQPILVNTETCSKSKAECRV